MTLLGLDFDNTLVIYDKLFHQIAMEKKLINESIPFNKKFIREHIINQGKEQEFTLMQGEVYGSRILEAEPANGMMKALREIKKGGIEIAIVSHKTKYPYMGPKYDLRKAAIEWMKKYGLFKDKILNEDLSNVHFENTKEEKSSKIKKLGCKYFVDDLESILDIIDTDIIKIHYTKGASKYKTMKHWNELKDIIEE